jgi:uncharacterized membrane protein (UPF0127 family)
MNALEKQFEILKSALANDYKGSIGDLIKKEQIANAKVARTKAEQEQGLRGAPPGSSMVFPNVSGPMNTVGMSEPIDIKKVDNQGNLVRSYKSVPPGIQNLSMGEDEGTVIESPGTYQKGGVRKYQDAGFDKDAFINQFLEEEKTGTTKTAKNKGILSNTVSTTQGSKYYNKDGTPMTFEEKNVKVADDKEATKKHVIQAKEDITEFLTDPVKAGDAIGMTGIPIVSEVGDLLSAAASTYRGNYGDASLSMAGIAVPFAGGAVLKQGKNVGKKVYNVLDRGKKAQLNKQLSDLHQPGIVKNSDAGYKQITTREDLLKEYSSRNNAYRTVNINGNVMRNEELLKAAEKYGFDPSDPKQLAEFMGTTPTGGVGNRAGFSGVRGNSDVVYYGDFPGQTHSRYGRAPDRSAYTSKINIFEDDVSKLSNDQIYDRISGLDNYGHNDPSMGIFNTSTDIKSLDKIPHGGVINTNTIHPPGISTTTQIVGKQNIPIRQSKGILSGDEIRQLTNDGKNPFTTFKKGGLRKYQNGGGRDSKVPQGVIDGIKPATSQTDQYISQVRATHDAGHESLYTITKNYLIKTGRNMDYVRTVMSAIGNHESYNNPEQKQVSYKTVDGKRVPFDGPGRGTYQFENTEDGSGNTAVNVTKQFLENKGNIDFREANHSSVNKLKDNYQNSSSDFSTFDKEDQDAIFLIEKIYHGTQQRDAFDKLVKGKKPPTDEQIFEFWGKYHKKSFSYTLKDKSKVKYSWDKLPKKYKDEERKKWNNRKSTKKQDGGFYDNDLYQIEPLPTDQIQSQVPIIPTVTVEEPEDAPEVVEDEKEPEVYDHNLTDVNVKDMYESYDRNIEQNNQIRAEKEVKESAAEVVKTYFGQYTRMNQEDVEEIQREIIASGRGDMLGSYGPNKDGVDGKFGPMTKLAYEQVLMDKLQTTQSLYFDPANRDSFCYEDGCAEYVNNEYEREGYDAWGMGVGGHAWTMEQNIIDHGGVQKFSIYNHSDFDNVLNANDARTKSIVHRKTNQPSAEIFQVGDVVGLVYDNSREWEAAYDGHTGDSYNTHVGWVTEIRDGVPYISHQINATGAGGIVHEDAYNDITGGGIAWVTSPKTNKPQWKYQYESEEIQHDNDAYIEFLAEKREKVDTIEIGDKNNKVDNKILIGYTDKEKEILNDNINFVKNNVAPITSDLGIEIDHNWLSEAVLATAMHESHLGLNKPTDTKIAKSRILRNIIGEESDRGAVSRGILKIKLDGTAQGTADYYNLNDANIDDQDSRSLAYTIDRFARRYAVLSKYATDNPSLGLTEQDVRNMTILTHNQGSGKLFKFGQNEGMSIDAQLELLREGYFGETSDLSGTNWGRLESLFGKEFALHARDKLSNDENPEAYISQINRYINRRLQPYTAEEDAVLTASIQKTGGYKQRLAW